MLQKQFTIAGIRIVCQDILSRLLNHLQPQPKKGYAPGIFVLQLNKPATAVFATLQAKR